MAIPVKIGEAAFAFIQNQPPEPRRRLREALWGLGKGLGNVKTLQGIFQSYHWLRVGSYRIIFVYGEESGRRVIRCLVAGKRDTIYEIFADMVADRLREKWEKTDSEAKPRKIRMIRYRIPRQKAAQKRVQKSVQKPTQKAAK